MGVRRSFYEREDLFRQFGGRLLGQNGHAREARPVSPKHSMHLVLRSDRARGANSMRHKRHRRRIDQLVYKQAKLRKIRIYKYANVGNHLHILLKPSSRAAYVAFIKALSGLIARQILKAEKNAAKGLKFWNQRPFSRVVHWGRAFKIAKNYVQQNAEEARSGLSRSQIKILEEEERSGSPFLYQPTAEELREIWEDTG